MKISKLTTADLDAVDDLMKQNSHTLGFLTRETIRSHLEKECVLGAKTDNDELTGYLLYAAYPERFRLIHLCVRENFRSQGIAKRLLEKLKDSATTQKVIKLNCRRDFPAHKMWEKLDFVPLGEKASRSAAGHLLTFWCLTLAPNDQLSLFQAKASDDALDVVIDAQVFFDFYEPDSDKTKPSKALLDDFLVDSLNLCITDELFNEINRSDDAKRRQASQQRAYEFPKVEHNPQSVEHFQAVLKKLLPSDNEAQQSDIRQLAKTAASDAAIFITRDQSLLKKSKKISDLTNLQVFSPTNLIRHLHELSERQSYLPTRISGIALEWRRLIVDDLASFSFESFLNQNERKGKFREKLELFLASPDRYECERLRLGNKIVAIRVLENGIDKTTTVHLGRVAPSADRSLFECFLVTDTVGKAVKENRYLVKFEKALLAPSLTPNLLKAGFIECNESFVRFCFARCLDRQQVSSMIAELCPESISNYQNMPDLELERSCSPLNLEEVNQEYFLIPVRPGYAMSLVDTHGAANDLFGGETSVLLRWDNVYYRKKTHHNVLQPPARILWYVSGSQKQIVAVSHLDNVEIGAANALFKKFKKFGILEWRDFDQMCKGNPSKELMALQFSHTLPFREPVSLEAMRSVYKKGIVVQGPSRIPPKTFDKLFQLGYPDQP
ncbi:MAG: GNAT family N-acetyltransferase [Nitrospira sp.]|nr:GNAT family N-acetyltransferase [Nitrospira sp.]MDE0503500.1 GNAT family N-acetyltransferase [Candidatus Poribacteria bacterium]